jgi:glycerophosphoryl diester phosphodiesterase
VNTKPLRAVLTLLLVAGFGCGPDAPETSDPAPAPGSILIAHRGASAYAPEHSREAYELGIEQGADFIEPDLQITRDGVLIALHDLTLERTTNVRDVFPDRFRATEVRGELVDVWVANDFTLEEIQQLDAGSWFGVEFAGTPILTLAEVIDLVRGRAGLFIETKAPEVYGDRGFDMEALLLEELARHGLDQPGVDPETPIVIQSFSAASLRLLHDEHGTALPLALLIGGGEASREWLTPEGLSQVATFATGIGPTKSLLLDIPGVIDLAHEHGLTVVPWTFRGDDPGDWDTVDAEMAHYLYELGVDGIITNNPDLFPTRPPPGGP